MTLINGKQLRDASIPASKLEMSAVPWKSPVAVKQLVGNATVATINGLTPTTGDAYVMTDAGTITVGSLAVVAGDMVEYSGTAWLKIIAASGGYPPAGTRALLATQTALVSPYTDSTDDGKVVAFTGASLTGASTSEAVDGFAVVVNGNSGVFANSVLVFSGTVPTGTWEGSGYIVAGAGLSRTLDTINVGDVNKGVQVNSNDLQIDASEIDGAGLEQLAGAGNEHILKIKLDVTTGGGVHGLAVSADGIGIAAAAAGTGLTGGGGSALAIAINGENVTFGTSIWQFAPDTLQVVGTPDTANDAVNKAYVDNSLSGLEWKNPVLGNLLGNVQVTGLLGSEDVATINGLTPATGDAYVMEDAGTLTTGSLAVVAGDTVQYDGAAWILAFAQSGGYPPAAAFGLMKNTGTFVGTGFSGYAHGDLVNFDGATLYGSATSPDAGHGYVIGNTTVTTSAGSKGTFLEWSGTAWVSLKAAVGGFVAAGTRAVVGLTPPYALIAPYVDSTDDGKVVVFSGSSNTGANTGDAVDTASLLFQDPGHVGVFDNAAYVFEGTVPTGSWIQWNGAGQLNAGAGLTMAGNTINVGDAGKGVQVNADNLQIDASEIDGDGLEQLTGVGNEHILKVKPDVSSGGNVQAVNVVAQGVGLDVSAIAGTGIEADGNANLRLAAQGNGITGGAGATLSVLADGTSISVGVSGVKAAVPTVANKNQQSAVTSGNGSTTTLTITSTPSGDGMVCVLLNGVQVVLGNGVKTTDCYFSVDSGVTARAISAITAADTLYWNGVVAGYDLAITDYLDFNYNVV